MSDRIDKINYYLDIAKVVANRSTCMRKKVGCVIVKNDEIIATGYNGAPRGRQNCNDLGYCCKKKNFPGVRHAGYDACRAVHAEQNAMLSANRKDLMGANMYIVLYRTDTGTYEEGAASCQMCRKLIINAGIDNVYARVKNDSEFEKTEVREWIEHDDLLEGKMEY